MQAKKYAFSMGNISLSGVLLGDTSLSVKLGHWECFVDSVIEIIAAFSFKEVVNNWLDAILLSVRLCDSNRFYFRNTAQDIPRYLKTESYAKCDRFLPGLFKTMQIYQSLAKHLLGVIYLDQTIKIEETMIEILINTNKKSSKISY